MRAGNITRSGTIASIAAARSEGELDGTHVTCPWHGWEYDITTGKNLDDPSVTVGCFTVKVEGDDILVET